MRFFDEPDTDPVGPLPIPAAVGGADEIELFDEKKTEDIDPTPAPSKRTRRAKKARLSESQIHELDDGPTRADVTKKVRAWLVNELRKPQFAAGFADDLAELAASIETAEARERLISGAEEIGLELTVDEVERESYFPGTTARLTESTDDDSRRFAATLR